MSVEVNDFETYVESTSMPVLAWIKPFQNRYIDHDTYHIPKEGPHFLE